MCAFERVCSIHVCAEDFLEALCRMATMKCMPTDDEVAQCGCSDGGHMLLSMNPAERRKFAIQRPQTWDGPMRQPIGRAAPSIAPPGSHTSAIVSPYRIHYDRCYSHNLTRPLCAKIVSAAGAMNHLITYMIRIIEDTVSVLWKAPQEGDLKLSRKEVQAFKKIGGLAGADSGSPGP